MRDQNKTNVGDTRNKKMLPSFNRLDLLSLRNGVRIAGVFEDLKEQAVRDLQDATALWATLNSSDEPLNPRKMSTMKAILEQMELMFEDEEFKEVSALYEIFLKMHQIIRSQ